MKKTIAIIMALLMAVFIIMAPNSGRLAETDAKASSNIYGFSFVDHADGSDRERLILQWTMFSASDPLRVSDLGGFLVPNTTDEKACVAAAEYYNGYVYGFTGILNESASESVVERYFRIDFKALASGAADECVEYIGAPRLMRYTTYDMAYDYSSNMMYVLGRDNAVSAVVISMLDLNTGITEDAAYLQSEKYNSAPYCFTIAKDGTAYCLMPSMGEGENSGYCELCTLDLETGMIGNAVVSMPGVYAQYEQSICMDHQTGKIYWAQYAGIDNLPWKCYELDPATGTYKDLGPIGSKDGRGVLGMFIPYGGISWSGASGDADENGKVEVTDALRVMRHAMGIDLLTGEALANCDVNADGKVDIEDALIIMRRALGI